MARKCFFGQLVVVKKSLKNVQIFDLLRAYLFSFHATLIKLKFHTFSFARQPYFTQKKTEFKCNIFMKISHIQNIE